MNPLDKRVSEPRLLNSTDPLDGFDCGEPDLNDWLRRRAKANQGGGASRTYVVTDVEGRIAGYYALAAGALASRQASGALRRNMPDPIPMVVLGRLAVDRAWQGEGLGAALLRDAVERAATASRAIGVRGSLVHAVSEAAAAFYRRHGFIPTPDSPLTLVLSLKGL
jgi:GNAT superfamily N-acetyltransferase